MRKDGNVARCVRCKKIMFFASKSGYCKDCGIAVLQEEQALRKAEELRRQRQEEYRRAEEERRRSEELRRKREQGVSLWSMSEPELCYVYYCRECERTWPSINANENECLYCHGDNIRRSL